MSYTVNINSQDYTFETDSNGYTYYQISYNQRFGKKVKAKNGVLLVYSGIDGIPSSSTGLHAVSWGTGSAYS